MKKLCFWVCLMVLFNATAWAKANLSIWPVQLMLWPEQKMGEVHLTNKGETDANIQVSAKSWDMDENGKFIETDTGDFVFFPRLMTIPAGQDGLIRLGYNGGFPSLEKAYRVYIQELPEIRKPDQKKEDGVSMGINTLLKISLPLFVSPSQKKQKPEAVIDSVEKQTDKLRVAVRNKGNQNFLVQELKARLIDKNGKLIAENVVKTAGRILPQRRFFYDLPLNPSHCAAAKTLSLDLSVKDIKDPLSLSIDLVPGCLMNGNK